MKKILILAALVALACAPADDVPSEESAPAQASAPAEQPAAFTDPQIAAIVVAANGADADLGEFAAGKSSNAAVVEFAKTMVRDHRAVNEQAAALVARLGVTPEATDLSRKLVSDNEAFRSELSGKSGAEFDRAYIEHEVAYHKAVIAAVDDALLPAAQNAELKATIEGVRPALVAHLQHAEKLQSELK